MQLYQVIDAAICVTYKAIYDYYISTSSGYHCVEIQVNNIHEILIVKCLYVELFSSILCLELSHSHSGMGIRIISWEFIFLSLVSCNSKLKPASIQ